MPLPGWLTSRHCLTYFFLVRSLYKNKKWDAAHASDELILRFAKAFAFRFLHCCGRRCLPCLSEWDAWLSFSAWFIPASWFYYYSSAPPSRLTLDEGVISRRAKTTGLFNLRFFTDILYRMLTVLASPIVSKCVQKCPYLLKVYCSWFFWLHVSTCAVRYHF